MNLNLDKSSVVPLGEQLQTQLEVLILSDRLKPGEQLPTASELAGELAVNPNTVAAAYRALARAGYLSQNKRAGTRVAAAPPRGTADLLALRAAQGIFDELRALGLEPEEILRRVGAEHALAGARIALKVAVLGRTPLEASQQAERVQAVLGETYRCFPQTLKGYHSLEYHLTVVTPELLASLSPEPFVPRPEPVYGPDFPAGAD